MADDIQDFACGAVPAVPGNRFSLPGAPAGQPAMLDLEESKIEALQRELSQQQARHLERIEGLLLEQEARLVSTITAATRAAGLPGGIPHMHAGTHNPSAGVCSLGSVFSVQSLRTLPSASSAPTRSAAHGKMSTVEQEPSSLPTRRQTTMRFTGGRKSQSEHNSRLRHWARFVTEHKCFEAGMAVVIIFSALSLGWQMDWSVKNVGQPQPISFLVTEYVVNLACTFELLVRLLDEAKEFFNPRGRNFMWNLFETVIILSAWGEEVIRVASLNVSGVRIARLLRLARILRIVRVVRFFRELRLMVQGILASLKPFVWCMSLLLIIMFCAGMVIIQVIVIELTDNPHADHGALLHHFGGIIVTMYTLYMSMTGGISWGEPAAELSKIDPAMVLWYSSFIAFSVLCLLNVVTGLFVDNANAITKTDADNMVMEELCAQDQRSEEMRQLFELAAGPGAEKLQEHQFLRFIQEKKVRAYFSRIGLNVQKGSARALFRLIDIDSNGEIGVSEFVEGCAQFTGTARQLDIARLRREVRKVAELMDRVLSYRSHEPVEVGR